jgi:hypothetical protein
MVATLAGSPVSQDYGPHKNELTGRVPGVEITIAAAAESSDQLIGPEQAVRLAVPRQ